MSTKAIVYALQEPALPGQSNYVVSQPFAYSVCSHDHLISHLSLYGMSEHDTHNDVTSYRMPGASPQSEAEPFDVSIR